MIILSADIILVFMFIPKLWKLFTNDDKNINSYINNTNEINSGNNGKKKSPSILMKPKRYKRVRKTVKKEKVEVIEKPKINNIWGSVLFLSVVIGCFQLSMAGIISILKNRKNDSIIKNFNMYNQKDKNKFNETTTDLFNISTYTIESPTETDAMSALTTLPTSTKTSINKLEYSKSITKITPTSTIRPTTIQEIHSRLTAFEDNNKKNKTMRNFNKGNNSFDNIMDYDNDINKYYSNKDFEKRIDTNSNTNNEKDDKEENDEKYKRDKTILL